MFAFAEMSTNQVATLDPTHSVLIWPVASLEQHGPYLPLGTDAILLEGVIEGVRDQMGEAFPGFVLPQMNYGKSPEHLAFAGTVSMQATTLLAVVNDVVASLVKHHFHQFVFVNTHGGNTALLQAVSYDLRDRYDAKVFCCDVFAGDGLPAVLRKVFPGLNDDEVHAASLETSVMMYLHPELVGANPRGNPARPLLELGAWGWASQDFGKSGVIGDPTHASLEAGKVIYEYGVNRVCELLRQVNDLPGLFH